jgi:molybdenum cofactor cytidylyltransferase
LKFGVVILAAGASTRMGAPKLLLKWGTSSVIGHLILRWRELGAGQVAVVLDPSNKAMTDELDRLSFPSASRIINPDPQEGMFSSVQSAARWHGWSEDITHWIIVLGDQPHLPSLLLRQLVEFAALHPESVSQPSFRNKPRHPVILPAQLFHQLANSSHPNLREFLQASTATRARCPFDDAALDLDIDQPADYQKALRLFPPVG